ncbi:MAG: hypothetical protein ICV73_23710, partial [Acetobacteraceae bacterium]|nr:hypothetical protein [Acetobacteraceae bacterium]
MAVATLPNCRAAGKSAEERRVRTPRAQTPQERPPTAVASQRVRRILLAALLAATAACGSAEGPAPNPQAAVDAEAIRSAADRAFTETQENANAVRGVRDSFEGILEQLVNNRVHTEKQ